MKKTLSIAPTTPIWEGGERRRTIDKKLIEIRLLSKREEKGPEKGLKPFSCSISNVEEKTSSVRTELPEEKNKKKNSTVCERAAKEGRIRQLPLKKRAVLTDRKGKTRKVTLRD